MSYLTHRVTVKKNQDTLDRPKQVVIQYVNMRARQYRFTLLQMAEAAKKRERQIRIDKSLGRIDPENLVSVAEYVVGWRMVNRRKK